ncbi:MAG: MarR family transcriptional regulator [Pseudarthrobacter sp.]|jgi:DNA-binding MarR family transcriptional regulator|nr:MarR family transcriptional regulator [Pseudarthrobacter sp.]
MTTDSGHDLEDGYRLLSQAARLVQRRHNEVLAPLGLTWAAAVAMEGLAAGPLNQEQLAAAVHAKSQTLGRILTRLQSEGLVSRTRDRRDRRQLVIGLTDAGRTALNAVRHAHTHAFPSSLDPRGWKVLRGELARFVDCLQTQDREGPPPAG